MITKALLLKGIAGVSAVTSAVAVGWKFDSIRNFLSGRIELTKWDDALIKAIDKEGNTIKFNLSSGNNTNLSDFPAFTDTADQNPATTQEASITFSFSASDQTYHDTDKLKKLNQQEGNTDGTAWTWECAVKFMRKKTDSTQPDMSDEDKKRSSKETQKACSGKSHRIITKKKRKR